MWRLVFITIMLFLKSITNIVFIMSRKISFDLFFIYVIAYFEIIWASILTL